MHGCTICGQGVMQGVLHTPLCASIPRTFPADRRPSDTRLRQALTVDVSRMRDADSRWYNLTVRREGRRLCSPYQHRGTHEKFWSDAKKDRAFLLVIAVKSRLVFKVRWISMNLAGLPCICCWLTMLVLVSSRRSCKLNRHPDKATSIKE